MLMLTTAAIDAKKASSGRIKRIVLSRSNCKAIKLAVCNAASIVRWLEKPCFSSNLLLAAHADCTERVARPTTRRGLPREVRPVVCFRSE